MSESPVISVIIPNYNHRRFLPERLRSIFAQTYRSLEIIFLDDASGDGSVEYVRSQASPFPFRTIINEANSGSAFRQWQRGLAEARGEFIWIAESDDSCRPELLEKLLAAARRHPSAGLAYAQSKIIDERGGELESFLNYTDDIDPVRWRSDYFNSGRDEAAHYLIMRNTIPNASACLFRREALQDGIREAVNLRLCGDWLAYARICEHHDIAFVAETLNHYRRHAATVRARADADGSRWVEAYAVLAYIQKHFAISPEIHEAACRYNFRELRYFVTQAGENRSLLDESGLVALAEKFDPQLRQRLAATDPPRPARFSISQRARPWGAREKEHTLFLNEDEWTTVRAGPFRGRLRIDPLGREGLVSVRRIRLLRPHSAEVLWEAASPAEYRRVALDGSAHRLGSAEALEIFAWGAQPAILLPPPPGPAGREAFELECEACAASPPALPPAATAGSDPLQPDYANSPASPRRPPAAYAPQAPTDPPAVAIVTPFFNTGAIFSETAESIFRQSFQQWEWIIVNDGTTDSASVALLDSWRKRDPRVRVVDHPHNRGLSAARNTGVAAARAEYVVLLDSDDLLEPTFVEKCLWHLLTHPSSAFVKGYSIGFGAMEYVWTGGFHDGAKFLWENRVDPTCMLRRSVYLQIGGSDAAIRGGLEDWDFWLRAAHHGYWGKTITEPLNWYRRRAGHWDRWQNISDKKKRRQLLADFRRRYSRLWEGPFPSPHPDRPSPSPHFAASVHNRLQKPRRRAFFIVPHLELGGADRFTLDVIVQLTRRYDWEITVVTTRKSADPWAPAFAAAAPGIFMLHRFLELPNYPEFLKYLVGSRQPDVLVVTHSLLGYRLLPWLKATFPGLPLLDIVHIEMEDWLAGGYPRFSIDYRAYLQRTIASSAHLRAWMADRGHEEGKIEVCYTNVDATVWRKTPEGVAAARRRWEIPPGRAVILYAARFCDQKRPRLLPAIVENLSGRGLDFLLLLAGDGPDRAWLEENLCRRHPQSTRMLGAVPSGEMPELMAAADILLLPSQQEGIALVLFEAMSMGVVPVATAVGGQLELVSPDCGILLEDGPQLAEMAASSIAELLRNPGQRAAMAANGRAKIERFHTLERMAEQVHAAFLRAMADVAAATTAPADPVATGRRLARAIEETLREDADDDAWMQKTEQGKKFPRLVTGLAEFARRLPGVGPLARRVEARYGTQLGRIIQRWI